MPVVSRIVSIVLRLAQLAFAIVVTSIIGWYLDHYTSSANWPRARIIYSIVVSGLSILLSLLWLIPFTSSFTSWPGDLLLSAAWFAAFGVLVHWSGGSCNRSAFNWSGFGAGAYCGRWKVVEAFSFLSGVLWLLSAIVGIWFVQRQTRKIVDNGRRRGWGRSRV